MSFVAKAMFAGDLYDVATRVARETGDALVKAEDDAATARIYGRAGRQAAELGWCGVLIPESNGGVGGTLHDVCALAEATARYALALPIADACAAAPTLLQAAEHRALSAVYERIVDGSWRVAPVITAAGACLLSLDTNRHVVNGVLRGIDVTGAPTHLVISCTCDAASTAGLLFMSADMPDVVRTRYQGMDGRQSADLTFANVRIEEDALLASGTRANDAIERAKLLGATITCVTTVGAIGALIEETIRYLETRVQFGTRLSQFQVLRHKVAEIYVGYENLKAVVTALVEEADLSSGKWRREVSLAKLYAGELARFVAHAGIQLHGAMGMTEELLAARLARRVLMTEFEYGDRIHHTARLAEMNGARVADVAPESAAAVL
jgi:alkylation response protein AidB-like acyl-CoA dehydrogenase